MKCQCCGSLLGGMYVDQCGWFKINLCGKCAKEYGYEVNNLENTKKCASCGKRFIHKCLRCGQEYKWKKVCGACWNKSNPRKKITPATGSEPARPIQRKLEVCI